jgi:site-specific DNA-methyltransferase (adenine-specific)
MTFRIIQGDNRVTLKTLADNSVDAIVTDPPYGIDFLGKSWDANTGALETYQECLRVLKPGGHILAFSAARTYHHLAVTLEQAGFEIRDQIMWIYSSGFPKSQDVGRSIQKKLGVVETKTNHWASTATHNNILSEAAGKERKDRSDKVQTIVPTDPEAVQWSGWGTALKPAHEPIALARKPLHKSNSIARNCQQWGVGALNIDAGRIPYVDDKDKHSAKGFGESVERNGGPLFQGQDAANCKKDIPRGRALDKVVIGGGSHTPNQPDQAEYTPNEQGRFPSNVLGEILQADYQKYFYCPKVSRKERHIGFENLPARLCGPGGDDYVQAQDHQRSNEQGVVNSTKSMLETMSAYYIDKDGNPLNYEDRGDNPQIFIPGIGNIYTHGLKQEYLNWCKSNNQSIGNVGNNHPTVKPIELMKYLIKLITPPGGVVLDPFNGSGSTGCAAVELGFDYIGCELDPAYVEITNKRILAWTKEENIFSDLFKE